MIGWISLGTILWVIKNRMRLEHPEKAVFTINIDCVGKVTYEGETIMDFNTEEELNKKINFLQKGGSIYDVAPGRTVPKSPRKVSKKKTHKESPIFSGTNNEFDTSLFEPENQDPIERWAA